MGCGRCSCRRCSSLREATRLQARGLASQRMVQVGTRAVQAWPQEQAGAWWGGCGAHLSILPPVFRPKVVPLSYTCRTQRGEGSAHVAQGLPCACCPQIAPAASALRTPLLGSPHLQSLECLLMASPEGGPHWHLPAADVRPPPNSTTSPNSRTASFPVHQMAPPPQLLQGLLGMHRSPMAVVVGQSAQGAGCSG